MRPNQTDELERGDVAARVHSHLGEQNQSLLRHRVRFDDKGGALLQVLQTVGHPGIDPGVSIPSHDPAHRGAHRRIFGDGKGVEV